MALFKLRKSTSMWTIGVIGPIAFFLLRELSFLIQPMPDHDSYHKELTDADFVRENSTSTHHCFVHNSRDWIDLPRHGNNDDGMDESFLWNMLLGLDNLLGSANQSQSIMAQTMCYQQSRFLNHSVDIDGDEATLRLRSIRLIYVALHYHQHIHALPEVIGRHANRHCEPEYAGRQIGKFDFECPDARFLVVSLFQQGLGANIHYVAIQALMAGLALDRVVLFVNGAKTDHKHMRKAWLAASCGRNDAQCFFAPLSPCTLSLDQLQSANVSSLTRQEKSRLFSDGALPTSYENAKVVWFAGQHTVPNEKFGGRVAERLRDISLLLIDKLPVNDPRRPAMVQAA